MKLIEIVLRQWRRRNDGGAECKIYCKPICKCHNVTPSVQLSYANKDKRVKRSPAL
jgi:hypothetical protein